MFCLLFVSLFLIGDATSPANVNVDFSTSISNVYSMSGFLHGMDAGSLTYFTKIPIFSKSTQFNSRNDTTNSVESRKFN